jgi:hypothetical protein
MERYCFTPQQARSIFRICVKSHFFSTKKSFEFFLQQYYPKGLHLYGHFKSTLTEVSTPNQIAELVLREFGYVEGIGNEFDAEGSIQSPIIIVILLKLKRAYQEHSRDHGDDITNIDKVINSIYLTPQQAKIIENEFNK